MRLKRLELFGFKSFADRTVLDFDQTLNGIVGPNGCGKSNVVDAVRWVLGETRPTSMRGDEMADVIFKGSTSRPPLSVAEVTMVLDNAHGTIDERGEEVMVTRRVFKSGEGEYLIDGERVRLKDVREMLFDTGLGRRGYAVLEQGRIDAVLSANPIDRRSIFEEAAGISRYRQRKKEAESRLTRVRADLLRPGESLSSVHEHRLREVLTDQLGLRKEFEYLRAERAIAGADIEHADGGVDVAGDKTHQAPQDNAALLVALRRRSDPLIDIGPRVPVVPAMRIGCRHGVVLPPAMDVAVNARSIPWCFAAAGSLSLLILDQINPSGPISSPMPPAVPNTTGRLK